MNRLYVSGLALAGLLALGAPAVAQGAPAGAPPAGAPGARAARGGRGAAVSAIPAQVLGQALKLTEGQKDQIAKIQEKLLSDVKALRPKGSTPDPAAREKVRDLSQQANKDIQALLTPEQKKKLPAVAREMGALRTAGIPLVALPQLKLTVAQQKQIVDFVKDATASVKDLPADQRREKLRDAVKGVREKTQGVLTADQKKVLDELGKKQGRRGNRA